MKVRFYSDEYREGVEADWPAIPREGEIVAFHHRGGTSNLRVEQVRWQADTDAQLQEVEIHLTF